jgi:ribosome-associated toxin RatA of RatAB toxin-antitoxin module
MQHIARFILIDASVETVFAWVADYRNIPRFQPQFKSVRLLSTIAQGLGAQVELRGSFHGMPLVAHTEVTAFEPPQLLVSTSTGGIRSRSTWRFTPTPDAPARTRASLSLDYEVNLPGLGGLLGGMVQHEVEGMTIESLKRLKLLLEGRPLPD